MINILYAIICFFSIFAIIKFEVDTDEENQEMDILVIKEPKDGYYIATVEKTTTHDAR